MEIREVTWLEFEAGDFRHIRHYVTTSSHFFLRFFRVALFDVHSSFSLSQSLLKEDSPDAIHPWAFDVFQAGTEESEREKRNEF